MEVVSMVGVGGGKQREKTTKVKGQADMRCTEFLSTS